MPSPIIDMPVRNAKMEAALPLLLVQWNSMGKQAAPIMDGIIMHMEYTVKNALLPST